MVSAKKIIISATSVKKNYVHALITKILFRQHQKSVETHFNSAKNSCNVVGMQCIKAITNRSWSAIEVLTLIIVFGLLALQTSYRSGIVISLDPF